MHPQQTIENNHKTDIIVKQNYYRKLQDNLFRKGNYLYAESYIIVLKEIKYSNKWKYGKFSCVGRVCIVKIIKNNFPN